MRCKGSRDGIYCRIFVSEASESWLAPGAERYVVQPAGFDEFPEQMSESGF
jgi:hypothetical protein